MATKTATARNTTTPDSADLHITVTGAETPLEAMGTAVAFLLTSRYTKDATIYEAKQQHGEWIFWADFN